MRIPPLTCATLFSGGGLADLGFIRAGFTPILAVEWNPDKKIGPVDAIADVYADNIGDKHLKCQSVTDVDFRGTYDVDLGHASPSCKKASIANSSGGGESPEDIACGAAVSRFIDEARPKVFSLENVRGYKAFVAYRLILAQLSDLGYHINEQVVNSADFGVPQSRHRLILRAVRPDVASRVSPLPATHRDPKLLSRENLDLFDDPLLPWNGWYAAVADLLDRCPETQLAPWQLRRLPKEITDSITFRPKKYGPEERGRGYFDPNQPSATLLTDAIPDAILFRVTGQQSPTLMVAASEPAATISVAHPPSKYRAVLVHGTSTMEVREGDDPSACVMATVGTKAAMPRAVLVAGGSAGAASCPHAAPAEPCPTVKSNWGGREPVRALLMDNRNASRTATITDGEGRSFSIGNEGRRLSTLPTALLIDGTSVGDRPPTTLPSAHPAIHRHGGMGGRCHRAVLDTCRVIALAPEGDPVRCMARFQSVPDTYRLPKKRSLASTVVGNGVPCDLAYHIGMSARKVLDQ